MVTGQVNTLEKMRLRTGLSQEEFAKKAKLALKTYGSIERGSTQNPHPRTLRKIAEALNERIEIVQAALEPAPLSGAETLFALSVDGKNREVGSRPRADDDPIIDPRAYGAGDGAPAVNGFSEGEARYGTSAPNSDNLLDGPEIPANLKQYHQDYCECEKIFQTLAHQNAECDKAIFDTLYSQVRELNITEEWRLRLAHIRNARTIILANLGNILENTRDLFKIVHKTDCAVCVQLHAFNDQTDPEKASVRTIARDRASAAARNHTSSEKDVHEIGKNTISYRIFIQKQEFDFIPDIRKAKLLGNLETTSKIAGALYNAVFVKSIPRVDPESSDSILTLCVDTAGAFDPERIVVSKHFVREISWRIAVMLYWLEKLEEEHLVLKKQKSG